MYHTNNLRGRVTFLLKLTDERLYEYSGIVMLSPIVTEILIGLYVLPSISTFASIKKWCPSGELAIDDTCIAQSIRITSIIVG